MAERRIRRTRKRQRQSVKKKHLVPERAVSGGKRQKISDIQPVNQEHKELIKWFQTVKFRKKLIGGIDESHLWKRLEELNNLYEAALKAERIRYDVLLREYTKSSSVLTDENESEERDSAELDDEKESDFLFQSEGQW